MASVITSARRSTASIFDVVYVAAEASSKLLSTGARSIDMLDAKAQLMHKRIITNSRAQQVNVEREEILRAAEEHADFLYELDRRIGSDSLRKSHFDSALEAINSALAE